MEVIPYPSVSPPLRLQLSIVPKISPNGQGRQVLILCSTLGSCQPRSASLSISQHAPRKAPSPDIQMVSNACCIILCIILRCQSRWFCSVKSLSDVQVASSQVSRFVSLTLTSGVPDVSERSLNLCWPKARHASPAPMNRNASVASFTTSDTK